nr:prepilin-type N-terminal cleavage/methylation domain-containing protein [Salinicola sp. S1-1-2]
MRRPRGHGARQAGVSLIELMIALAIGVIMILAVSRIYLASAGGAQEAEARATLDARMRFLHGRLSDEFRRADFWGRVPAAAERTGNLTLDNDCEGDFAFGRGEEASVATADRPLGVWASRQSPAGCSLHEPREEQTFVAVRYASEPCESAGCDGPAISSFYPFIGFFSDGAPPATPERAEPEDHWQYGGSLYYLSEDNDALRRLWITGSGLASQEVLQGVEALAFRWHDENGWRATETLSAAIMPRVDAVEIDAVVSVAVRATYRETAVYRLSDGREVASAPGRLYRRFTFVVPIEMHRMGDGDAP